MVGSRLQQLFVREETQQTATSQTDHTHKQFKEVHSITYALPGQVGFCVPDIIKESKYRQSLIALLEGDNLVTSLQVNNTTGSILISYKAGVMPDVEMRSHFANLIESVSDEWNADEQAKMQPVIADTKVSQIEAKDTRVSPRLLRSFSRAINKFLPALTPRHYQRLLIFILKSPFLHIGVMARLHLLMVNALRLVASEV